MIIPNVNPAALSITPPMPQKITTTYQYPWTLAEQKEIGDKEINGCRETWQRLQEERRGTATTVDSMDTLPENAPCLKGLEQLQSKNPGRLLWPVARKNHG